MIKGLIEVGRFVVGTRVVVTAAHAPENRHGEIVSMEDRGVSVRHDGDEPGPFNWSWGEIEQEPA